VEESGKEKNLKKGKSKVAGLGVAGTLAGWFAQHNMILPRLPTALSDQDI
jgi:hypothetical protein